MHLFGRTYDSYIGEKGFALFIAILRLVGKLRLLVLCAFSVSSQAPDELMSVLTTVIKGTAGSCWI